MTTLRLDADLHQRLKALSAELDSAADALQDVLDERSERWRDSDAGTEAEAWIETLREVAGELDRVEDRPGS